MECLFLFPKAHAIECPLLNSGPILDILVFCQGTGGLNMCTHRYPLERELNQWLREFEERKDELMSARPIAGWALKLAA